MTRVACVIPALDAAATLGSVIDGLRRIRGAEIVVVDDGSRDETSRVAHTHGAHVVRRPVNAGKGAALRAGFLWAEERRADGILTIDADGQHDPRAAPALLAALAGADLVIGARTRDGSTMPLHRRLTNALSSAAVRAITGARLADTQSGYRAMHAGVARRIAARGDGYDFEIDFLLRAARAGLRITSVEVPTVYGTASHFDGLRDGARVVGAIWRHRAGAWS